MRSFDLALGLFMLSIYVIDVYLNSVFLAAFLDMTVSLERQIIHLTNRLKRIYIA